MRLGDVVLSERMEYLPLSPDAPLGAPIVRASSNPRTLDREVELRGTLHGEPVAVRRSERDFEEGVRNGWPLDELALIFLRLDRFARREI